MVLPSLNRGYTAAKYAIVDTEMNTASVETKSTFIKTLIQIILVIEIC